MIFTYRKTNGELVCYSEGKNEFSNPDFVSVEYEPTEEEREKLKHGYLLFWRGGLVFEKTPVMLDKEKKEKMRESYVEDIENIQKAKDINGVREILTKLATYVYNQ